MRDDQRERLEALNEKLIDVLIEEADPDAWPGAGKPLATMTKGERGDRYWSKKSAAMTTVLIGDNFKLLANTKAALGRDPLTEPELDDRIQRAEAVAAKRLDAAIQGAAHAAFAGKTYGKGTH